MKLTLTNIKLIKQNEENKLTKNVCDYIINHWADYKDKKAIFTDVLDNGCQSGIVSELVYYSDTTKYYQKYQEEINKLLYECLNDCGITSPKELFGKKWDEEDPLAYYDYNQNLLAWFGFEETLRNIAYKFDDLEDVI